MAPESPIDYWRNLETAADEGQLFLDSDAARNCDQACNQYLDHLRNLHHDVFVLADVQGMGDFNSGIALAKKFSLKASGGENNLADVLQGHIDVVMAMQAVFRKFFDAAEAIDRENAGTIGSHGPK